MKFKSFLSIIGLVLFFSCETKVKKEEPVAICGNALLPESEAATLAPITIEENCSACHAISDFMIVGSPFTEISEKGLLKEKIISLLKDPKRFNDTSKIAHPDFNYLGDSTLIEISNWIDTIRYLKSN